MRFLPALTTTFLLAAVGPATAADPPSCVPDSRSKACLAARAAVKECDTVARAKLDALARRSAGRASLSTGEQVAIRQEQERTGDEQTSCQQGVR